MDAWLGHEAWIDVEQPWVRMLVQRGGPCRHSRPRRKRRLVAEPVAHFDMGEAVGRIGQHLVRRGQDGARDVAGTPGSGTGL